MHLCRDWSLLLLVEVSDKLTCLSLSKNATDKLKWAGIIVSAPHSTLLLDIQTLLSRPKLRSLSTQVCQRLIDANILTALEGTYQPLPCYTPNARSILNDSNGEPTGKSMLF